MADDLLYEYDWTDPESLGLPSTGEVTFNVVDTPFIDTGYWRDSCDAKRWKADGECGILKPQYAFVGNTTKTVNWADAVIHSPTARGGVYYVSDDGQATLTWDELACIWILDGAWTADSAHGSVDINVRMYCPKGPPSFLWIIPYVPSGDYSGVWVDDGRNMPVLDGATVEMDSG